jgi:hypothetical protein
MNCCKNIEDGKCTAKYDTVLSERCLKCELNKDLECQQPSEVEMGCLCMGSASIKKQNTAYEEDYQNYVVSCDSCFKEIKAYWEERWAEYYASI